MQLRVLTRHNLHIHSSNILSCEELTLGIVAPPQTAVEGPLLQPAAEHIPPRTDRPPTAHYSHVLSLQTGYPPLSPLQMIVRRQTQCLAVVSRMHYLWSWLVTMGRVGSLDDPFTTPPKSRF